jgi:hypothetical protein
MFELFVAHLVNITLLVFVFTRRLGFLGDLRNDDEIGFVGAS